MRTPMLKRRLNPFLLASTVLILSLLAGLSVLYQGQLDNVMSDKQDLIDDLSEKEQELVELEQDKSNLTRVLSDTESDRDRYIELYESEQEHREELQDKIDSLEDDLARQEGVGSDLRELNRSLGDICDTEYDNFDQDSLARTVCETEGHR